MRIEHGFIIFSVCVVLTRTLRNRTLAEGFLLAVNLILLFAILFRNTLTEAAIILILVNIHFFFLSRKSDKNTFFSFLLPPIIFFSFRSLSPVAVLGTSYLIFRMLSASLEIKSGKVQNFSLRQYLSYCFFFHTFKMGPVGSFEDHLISENEQSSKRWNDLHWLQLFRVIFGVVKYILLAAYIRNFASAFGYTNWSEAGSLFDLIVLGFISYVSVYLVFSGFNDIGIGLSHFLGYRMKENFAHPFKAGSVGEFWSNWHMSVTELLKDLIFYPLSITLFRKVGPQGKFLVMPFIYLVLFVIIGVWHGPGSNFVLLGFFHAAGATVAYYFSLFMTKTWAGYKKSQTVKVMSIILTQIFIALSFFIFDNDLDAIKKIIGGL